jgi:hypothetical protein
MEALEVPDPMLSLSTPILSLEGRGGIVPMTKEVLSLKFFFIGIQFLTLWY